jgi:hypothetical protein
VNFAFLELDGVPAGPPSPQLANTRTFTPNARTLRMNQGDVLAVTIGDTPQGLLTRVVDFSTGQTGFMVASTANGFMNTNIADCSGTPFNFHAEYSTARQQNQLPWAALEGGVLMQQKIGHFEPCSSVTSQLPVNNDRHLEWQPQWAACRAGSGSRSGQVGAGEGADATWLAKRGWRVTAVDISPVALERAARRAAAAGKGAADRITWLEGPLTEVLPSQATGSNGRLRTGLAARLLEAHRAWRLSATIGRASDFFGPRVRLSTVGERVFGALLCGKPAELLGNPDLPYTVTISLRAW